MSLVPDNLLAFDPISLHEMDAVKLLDRLDVKFMFHSDQLEEILQQCVPAYRILSIAGSRYSRYETRYFDTPGMEMYTQHHNGKLNRYKVRFREYVDSGSSYFEVKFKTNKGRTIKDRIQLADHNFIFDSKSELLLKKKTGYSADMLREAIQVNYNRITLVGKNIAERLTIDFGLTFRMNGQLMTFPSLVIAEVKQDKAARSPFIALMQDRFVHQHSLSKYCLGVACMNPNVKTNNFKPKLLSINKLCHDYL